jgi:3-deoxy-D-manno-octulosonate 8-phosphate phosphatase (KDO 8-P phosphatase)
VDGVVTGLRIAPPRWGTRALSTEQLVARAQRVRLVLTDCDGVLTDGTVYVSEHGEALKRFSLRDGMGVERLREAGIETAIVTRERSPIVARRAEKLRLPHLFEGVLDKAAELARILAAAGCGQDEVAYIGDDVNDLGILGEVGREGLTAAPFDALETVADAVHHVCRARGGEGAFREFAEWILRLRGAGKRDQDKGEVA